MDDTGRPQHPGDEEEPIPELPSINLDAIPQAVGEDTTPHTGEGEPSVDPEETKGRLMMEMVFPAFLDATHAVALDAPDAIDRIDTLLGALEHNARELQEPADGFWSTASTLCRAILVEHEPALDLIERTRELDTRDGFAWKTQCVLCYIGASVSPQVIPRLAINLHMAVAEYIYARTVHAPVLYETIILPWFCAYWQRTFEQARYRFIGPRFLEGEIKTALAAPPPVRLQRVLSVIALGLGEPLPQRGRAWFNMRLVSEQAEVESGTAA